MASFIEVHLIVVFNTSGGTSDLLNLDTNNVSNFIYIYDIYMYIFVISVLGYFFTCKYNYIQQKEDTR